MAAGVLGLAYTAPLGVLQQKTSAAVSTETSALQFSCKPVSLYAPRVPNSGLTEAVDALPLAKTPAAPAAEQGPWMC